MAEQKRCPQCSAQNAITAAWCTLCLTRFDGQAIVPPVRPAPFQAPVPRTDFSAATPLPRPEVPPPPRAVAPPPPVVEAVPPVVEAEPVADPTADPTPMRAIGETLKRYAPAPSPLIKPPPPTPETPVRFVTDGGQARWVCPSCETMNDMDAPICRICGTAMARLLAPRDAIDEEKPKSATTASVMSAVLPGLGHLYLGAIATAASRGVFFLWTVGIAILLIGRPPAGGVAFVRAVGVLFAISAAIIWAVSFAETRRLAAGGTRPILTSRAMTVFSGALTLALFAGLAAAAFGQR